MCIIFRLVENRLQCVMMGYLCNQSLPTVSLHSHSEVQPGPCVVVIFQTGQNQVQIFPVYTAFLSLQDERRVSIVALSSEFGGSGGLNSPYSWRREEPEESWCRWRSYSWLLAPSSCQCHQQDAKNEVVYQNDLVNELLVNSLVKTCFNTSSMLETALQ